MRYAFHFIDEDQGWDALDKALLAAMLDLSRPSFVVWRGNVVHWDFGETPERIVENAVDIVTHAVSTIDPETFVELIASKTLYVQLVQGLTERQALVIHAALAPREDYVGVLRLSFENSLQWAVYGSKLPDAYRLFGRELRIRWRAIDGEEGELVANDRRDTWWRSGLFESVRLEEIGLRSTIFDSFDTPEHAALEAATLENLGDLLAGVANQVVLRASDLDPRLVEGLHAATQSLGTARTSDELAQAALSCRRFLERFADRVFPATNELREGRKLGPAEWKNRLWAFAEDALGETGAQDVAERLKDVGARIDWVVDSANAGVHRPDVEEVAIRRLVLGLVSLVFDLCLISPPPHALPGAAYEPHAMAVIHRMIKRDAQ